MIRSTECLLDYILEETAALAAIAKDAQFSMIAYFLQMAVAEASDHKKLQATSGVNAPDALHPS